MLQELTRVMEALERYSIMNHRPAVDEPANDFERLVNEHAEYAELITEVKNLLKPIEAKERQLRDNIAQSLRVYFAGDLNEGMNTYTMSNGRKVKFEHKVDRKVETPNVPEARAAYEQADDAPAGVTFDDLLRVKYELAKTPWKKLPVNGPAYMAVSRMLVTKDAAPAVKVD